MRPGWISAVPRTRRPVLGRGDGQCCTVENSTCSKMRAASAARPAWRCRGTCGRWLLATHGRPTVRPSCEGSGRRVFCLNLIRLMLKMMLGLPESFDSCCCSKHQMNSSCRPGWSASGDSRPQTASSGLLQRASRNFLACRCQLRGIASSRVLRMPASSTSMTLATMRMTRMLAPRRFTPWSDQIGLRPLRGACTAGRGGRERQALAGGMLTACRERPQGKR
mmetsp:Transcript_42918/g.93395  ORF Transcript_42918/g.93395 Transcript_42918/m.93395 type:complete len:222 (-) Transcript_42918:143-808(-)